MHCVITIMYGFIIWFSVILYALITEANIGVALLSGPFIVSGAVILLIAIDLTFTIAKAAILRIFKPRTAVVAEKNYELESATGAGDQVG